MPTAFTHAFVAGALAVGAPGGVPRTRLVLALAALAVVPDLDVVAFRLDVPYGHPLGHRGFTHSLAFAALAGGACAALLFRELGIGSRRWWGVAALLALGTASHGILDAFTDAGRGVAFFLPLDPGRHFFPWRPLATSPLSPGRFFTERGVEILANELLWVWLPVGLALALWRAGPRLATRRR